MRTIIRIGGAVLAATAGALLLGAPAQADDNTHNSGLINTQVVGASPQACANPVNVLALIAPVLSQPSVGTCTSG